MKLKPALTSVLALAWSWAALLGADGVAAEPAPDDHWWGGFGTAQGLNDAVHALTVFRGELIAGGPFTASGSGVLLDQVARWDGETWHQLEGGIDPLPCPGLFCDPRVNALTVFNGDLIVAGRFWTVDDKRVSARYIARWDGAAWHALGGGIDPPVPLPPEGEDVEVMALVVYNGGLVAGGSFEYAEGRRVNNLAFWDGNIWRSLGGGVTGGGSATYVQEVTLYDGNLVVAGGFSRAGDVAVNNIALWDGVTWNPLGEGSAETSRDAMVYGGDLYADGEFRTSDGTTIWGLGRWDGSSWHSTGTYNRAYDFAVYNGDLVLGDGGAHLLRWNGSSWLPFASGVNDVVSCLGVLKSGLYVGGKFTTAGGKPSARIARWDDVITPVTVQDLRAVATAQSVTLSWRLPNWWELQSVHVERAGTARGRYQELMKAPLEPEEFMTYVDGDVRPGSDYWYRLVGENKNSETFTLALLHVTVSFGLEAGLLAPIPMDGGQPIQVRYRIGQPNTPTMLRVHDVRGALIRSLDRGVRDPGEYSQIWDCRTEAGLMVPRGVYIIRLQAGRVVASRKVVVTRE